jgi:chemotaxis protein MotB
MKRYLSLVFAVVILSVAMSGCVSTGKYEKMEAGKNQEISGLQKEKATLTQQIADLEKQKTALAQQKSVLETSSQQRQAQYDALVRKLSAEVKQGQLQVTQYKNMLTVDVAEQIFFDSGKAALKDSGKDVLKKVGEALMSYDDKIIRVVGHTDNVPIAKAMQNVFPTNWELSVARATNVVRYLQDVGVKPERMVASGRSEYEPVASNDTAEGRQKNRRIEIMLIDQSLAEELSKPK